MRRPRTFADFNFPRLISRYVVALDHPPLRDASRTERPRRFSSVLGSIRPLLRTLGIARRRLRSFINYDVFARARIFNHAVSPPRAGKIFSHPLSPPCTRQTRLAPVHAVNFYPLLPFRASPAGALGQGLPSYACRSRSKQVWGEQTSADCHAGRLNASRFPPAPRSQWHAHARINSPRFSSRSVRR